MKIHIVSKVVDSLQNPETTLVGAYVDKNRADAKAQEIVGRKTLGDLQSLTYGVVESVELDLTGVADVVEGELDVLRYRS